MSRSPKRQPQPPPGKTPARQAPKPVAPTRPRPAPPAPPPAAMVAAAAAPPAAEAAPASLAICAAVCTYNRYDLLPQTIDSMLAQSLAPARYHVVVVDNSPDAELSEQWAQRWQDVANLLRGCTRRRRACRTPATSPWRRPTPPSSPTWTMTRRPARTGSRRCWTPSMRSVRRFIRSAAGSG